MSASSLFDIVIVAAIASFVMSMMIVLTQGWHGKYSLDNDLAGVQKTHVTPIPRVGGIAVLIGIGLAIYGGAFDLSTGNTHTETHSAIMLLLAGMPAFLAGLKEDLTKTVSVKTRLFATLASALLACWISGAYLSRLDIWGVDLLLQFLPFAIVITAFAVAGVANSINIIDGFNGVAGSAVVIMLAGLGFVAFQAGDFFVVKLALAGIGATLGFLAVNYPTGRLFMGDGGAYLLGFFLAEVAVLLVVRNPMVSTWQVFAICAYPVIEVLFSIYRRKMIRKLSPGDPDRLHLHTLIYHRLVCQNIARNHKMPWLRNAAVACFVAAWIATTTLIAVFLGSANPSAIMIVMAEVLAYVLVYRRLALGRWGLVPAKASTKVSLPSRTQIARMRASRPDVARPDVSRSDVTMREVP